MEEYATEILVKQRNFIDSLNGFPWKKQENKEFQVVGLKAFMEITDEQYQKSQGIQYHVVHLSQKDNGLASFVQSIIINEILELLAQFTWDIGQQAAILIEIQSLSFQSFNGKEYSLSQCTKLLSKSESIKSISEVICCFEGCFIPKITQQNQGQLKQLVEKILAPKWSIYQQSNHQLDVFENDNWERLRRNTPYILVQTSSFIQQQQTRKFQLLQKTEQSTLCTAPMQPLRREGSISSLNQQQNSMQPFYQESYNKEQQFLKEINQKYEEIDSLKRQLDNQTVKSSEKVEELTKEQNAAETVDYSNLFKPQNDDDFQVLFVNEVASIPPEEIGKDSFSINVEFTNVQTDEMKVQYCDNQQQMNVQLDNYQWDGYGYQRQGYQQNRGQEVIYGRINNSEVEGGQARRMLKEYIKEIENQQRQLIAFQQQHASSVIQQLETIDIEQRQMFEMREQEWLRVISERENDIEKLKGQLNDQKVQRQEEVEELKKLIDSLGQQLKEKEQKYDQQKKELSEESRQLAESQVNLKNQQLLTNQIEKIAKNTINELELLKEEKKMIQDILQGAIAETETKWQDLQENQIKQHQKTNRGYEEAIDQLKNQINSQDQDNKNLKQQLKTIKDQVAQSQKDFELALKEKQSIYTQLENKTQQTLLEKAGLNDELSDSKSIIVSYQQEAKKLQETIASLQEQLKSSSSIQIGLEEQLKDKIDQISKQKETFNDWHRQFNLDQKKAISKKDQEIQSIKDKAQKEFQLSAAANAKELLVLNQQHQEQTGKLIDITGQLNQYKFNAKESILGPFREAIRACSECNQPVPSIRHIKGKDMCLSCYHDYLKEFY